MFEKSLKTTKATHTATNANASKTTNKNFMARVNDALVAKSASTLLTVLKGATTAELAQLGGHSNNLKSLTKLKNDMTRNKCMDFIYNYVEKKSDMKCIFEERFGVNLGSGSVKSMIFKANSFMGDEEEKEWSLKGIKRLYKNYLLVPQSQIDEVDSVLTSTQKGKNGKADTNTGGFAIGSTDCYTVRFTDDNMARISGKGSCESKADRKYNMNATDCTMLHELGHVVDTGSYVYSTRDDFRSINGWKYEGKDAEEIVKKIEKYAQTPYAPTLNAEEIKIAHAGAVQMLKARSRKLTEAGIREYVKEGYNKLGKSIDANPDNKSFFDKTYNYITGNVDKGGYRSLDKILQPLVSSTVYIQIRHGLAEEATNHIPCYDNEIGGINRNMKTQIQEGYEKRGWYSFRTSAWTDKISRYQFREPCEEFAELFATYHLSKGTNVKAKHKAWFEGMGLHNGTQNPKKAQLKLNSGEKKSDIEQS